MTTSVSPTSTWPLTREHGGVRECLVSPWNSEPCPRVPQAQPSPADRRRGCAVPACQRHQRGRRRLRGRAEGAAAPRHPLPGCPQLHPGGWGVTGVGRGSYSVLGGVWGGGLMSCPWRSSPSLGVPSADGCWEMPRAEGLKPCPWWLSPSMGVPSGDGCQGMPSTGSDPNQGPHTVPFISIILHRAACRGWVPRDPGLGGSRPALGGCHSPQGPHC